MAGWLTNTIGNIAISWAAWAQNRYFEPEHYHSPWVVYSHDGTIEQCEHPPEPLPGVALWRRVSDTDQYERVDVPPPTQEPPTPIAMPIIQAVVRFHTHGRRQRRSRAKPRDFDITAEIQRFQGYPMLDWLHVGMCVKHAHGITVLPGQYTLSIIDAGLELHELSEEEAAVYSACPSTTSADPFDLGGGFKFDLGPFEHEPAPPPPPATPQPLAEGLIQDVIALDPAEDDPEPDMEDCVAHGNDGMQEEEEGDDAEPDFNDWETDGCGDVDSESEGGGADRASEDGDEDGEGDVVRIYDSDDDGW